MVTRMRPHSVLNMADARHVEGVEPDGSAFSHRERQYATGQIEKRPASVTDNLKGAFRLAERLFCLVEKLEAGAQGE